MSDNPPSKRGRLDRAGSAPPSFPSALSLIPGMSILQPIADNLPTEPSSKSATTIAKAVDKPQTQSSKPKKKERKFPTIDATYSKGDFSLITSDNFEFRVDKIHLQSSSAVFRDTLSIGNGPAQLRLTDTVIERSDVLTIILNCIHGEKPTNTDDESFDNTKNALLFTDKYDMPGVRQTLLLLLRLWPCVEEDGSEGTYPLDLFEVGARWDDPMICRQAFLEYLRWYESQGPDSSASASSSTKPQLDRWDLEDFRHDFDITAMPLNFIRDIPPKYLTAMARATKDEDSQYSDWKEVADRFVELIRELEECG